MGVIDNYNSMVAFETLKKEYIFPSRFKTKSNKKS